MNELRADFRGERCHHVLVPDVVDDAASASIREEVDAVELTQFAEPTRGHFELEEALVLPALFDELRTLAEEVVERPLRLARARWLRLRHRDYQLIQGDDRELAAAHVEVILDSSAVATGQADIVYTDGYESWVVPQQPRAAAIVAREPWLCRYQRYLNVALGDAILHRLRLSLSYLDPP